MCSVLISDLLANPFNLGWGSSVVAIVSAQNSIGSSVFSTQGSGAVILTIPNAPINVQNVANITNAYQIGIQWSNGLQNGGSNVIDYSVLYAKSSESVYTTISNINVQSYTITGLIAGTTYKIKV